MEQYNRGVSEVVIGGDHFLLSIPSVDDFDEFMREITLRDKQIQMETWEFMNPCFLYDTTGEATQIINSFYYDCDEVITFGRRKAGKPDGEIIVDDSDLAGLRLYLTPLTRSGSFDTVFDNRSGEIVQGGYLSIQFGSNVRSNTDGKELDGFYVGDATENDIVTISAQDNILILDRPEVDMEMKPLRWLVCNGGLISMQPILQCTVRDLDALHVLPYSQH